MPGVPDVPTVPEVQGARRAGAAQKSTMHFRHFTAPEAPWHLACDFATIDFCMSVERRTRPLERFWPYAEHPEEPTVEELAALDPDLHAALFGPRDLSFSITVVFGRVRWPGIRRSGCHGPANRPSIARSDRATTFRHRARFFPKDALSLRDAVRARRARTSGPRCWSTTGQSRTRASSGCRSCGSRCCPDGRRRCRTGRTTSTAR